jgi:hypothetical protein
MWQHERRKRGRSTRNAGNESDQPGNSGKKTLRRGRWFLKMAHGVALFSRPKSSQRKYILDNMIYVEEYLISSKHS